MYKTRKRFFSSFLAFTFLMMSVIQPVSAAVIGTEALLNTDSGAVLSTDNIQTLRQQISQVLIGHGVEAKSAIQRANALSHQELQLLQNRIDNMPAGQGALGLLGAVFLVLIVLEFLGVINVFTRA